jgi:alpha-galactosidase/6-phospho-beta-glucosidase family protein
VIRTPVSYRIETWDELGKQVPKIIDGQIPFELEQSDEEAIPQIKALLGLGDLVTNVNKKNVGQISNLPWDVVVETNARFSRDRVDPVSAGALPPGVETLVSTHVNNQEIIVEASLTEDEDLAFQAIFNDPCTTATIDDAWDMFQEATQAWP